MRFKVKKNDILKHEEISTDLSWTVQNEVYSIADDNIIYKWDCNTLQNEKFLTLENYPTCLDWMPAANKGVNEILALGFSDGSFMLITRTGKIDQHIKDAHKNAALITLKWSHDGSYLATGGEDGSIKTWSKTGNIRSNLVQFDKPIYSLCWNPDNNTILYSSEKNIFVKPLQAGQKTVQWKAHDGVVIKTDWNPCNNQIVSAGEDCKYKIWDSYGRCLYSSAPYDYVITSIAWAPNGEFFAVGAYGMLKLCDKTGWTYSFDKVDVGSVMQIRWSADSTICAGSCGSGHVIFGQVVERSLVYQNFEVNLIEDNKITVNDLINEMHEELDFKERVINMSMAYGNLIVTTHSQCYIYAFTNWNTPQIFDIKEAVSLIIQSPRYFCLVQAIQGIVIYSYEGRKISNPKIPGIKFELLNSSKISLSQDVFAIVDGANPKIIRFYDILSGNQMNFMLDHSLEVLEIHLNNTDQASDRKIAFMDINHDFYLSPVHKRDVTKLAAMTDSFLWNDKHDILSCIADGRLQTWYYPNAIYVDKDLMSLCKYTKESSDIGRISQMINFSGSQVTLRRKDGGLITLNVSPYPSILFDFCEKNKWEKAIKLCRFVKEQSLWACLAAVSLHSRELNTAEIALASIEAADKVKYIEYINELPSEISKQAALSVYFHKNTEAEQSLLKNKLFYRAIKLNIKLYKWERALELAVQNNVYVDMVIGYRKKYLEQVKKEETLKKFQQYQDKVEINWQQIKEKIKQEKEKEKVTKFK
ncbi:intraflagellar transport protein, putative [Ichthyophthirius multifiliis]|uniref:Intraflagellar transport protein, putative n=1 Tax=Ichthyophthirius multifiliis TaxID=5932 RepID=G0QLX5_ICHMU|nr:intraflagellar transport protein, putative [Ichthyophthirius multifiliis]EGR33781.1 intraflagellar transport protein, putative [Ichthyophthirius multifiliis]|eukprot:XP_004039005.1 intraflagellar transport protein, putative [Ichthyophthirius multifiliis]